MADDGPVGVPPRSEDVEERFWRTASPMVDGEVVTRSTMFGFPCLRVDGKFFASYDQATGDLIVKLSADRVADLIASGEGQSFAPAGRRFREWVAISPDSKAGWPRFLAEALQFVGEES